MYFLNSIEPGFRTHPFALFRGFENSLNRAVRGARPRAEFPAVNLFTDGDKLSLTAELPGIAPEKLELTVEGNTLTLKGERARSALKDGEQYVRQERADGAFSRTLKLPYPVNADAVEARYERGVLSVILPRAENDKPKKISIR